MDPKNVTSFTHFIHLFTQQKIDWEPFMCQASKYSGERDKMPGPKNLPSRVIKIEAIVASK